MQRYTVLMFVVCSSIALAQTDSMFVEKMDGTIRSYPISLINQIYFSGGPTGVREKELVRNLISSFALYQNYPNPFNPSTTIQYNVPKAGDVVVKIYNNQGHLVRFLSKSFQQAGTHSLVWDGRNGAGGGVASGIYFCRIDFNNSALVTKLVHLK